MTPAAKQRKNRFLMVFRKAHTWLGIVILAFVVIIGGTGFYLNHKKLFRPLLRAGDNREIRVMSADTPSIKQSVTSQEARRLSESIWKKRPIRKFVKRNRGGRVSY